MEKTDPKYKASFLQAVRDAQRIAAEHKEKIYIAHSEIYARSHDEYGESVHVVGSKPVFACMFDRIGTEPWGHLIGVVDPDGTAFMNNMEDTLLLLELIPAPERKINLKIVPEGHVRCPDHKNGGATTCPRGGPELQKWQRKQWGES